MALQTSDKVGLVASIVLAIVVTILVLWPSLKKLGKSNQTPPAPLPGTINAAAQAPVDQKGIPVAGAAVSPDGAPRQAAGATNVQIEQAPPAPPVMASFFNPSTPTVII